MSDQVCDHRWFASRVEVETAPVEHVCILPIDYDDGCIGVVGSIHEHHCSCGAVLR